MNYLATFHTHFDAMAFMRAAKTLGTAKMKPVPRQLSSSCGTCVLFTPTQTPENSLPRSLTDKAFEKLYRITETGYDLLKEKE